MCATRHASTARQLGQACLSLSLCHEICSAERCTRGIQTHRANACPTRSTSTFLHHRCGLGSDGSSSAFFDPNTRVNRVKNETSTKFHNGGQHDEREPHGAHAHGADREAQLRCCGHADLHRRDAESEWEGGARRGGTNTRRHVKIRQMNQTSESDESDE
jgi:hypothetical protein